MLTAWKPETFSCNYTWDLYSFACGMWALLEVCFWCYCILPRWLITLMSLASHNYRNGGWKAMPELYCSSGEAILLMFGRGKIPLCHSHAIFAKDVYCIKPQWHIMAHKSYAAEVTPVLLANGVVYQAIYIWPCSSLFIHRMSYFNFSQDFGSHWNPGCLPTPTVYDAIFFVLADMTVDL